MDSTIILNEENEEFITIIKNIIKLVPEVIKSLE